MGRFQLRLKTSLHGATVLGIAMIALTWGTIAPRDAVDHDQLIAKAD